MSVVLAIEFDRFLFAVKSLEDWQNNGSEMLNRSMVEASRTLRISAVGRVVMFPKDWDKLRKEDYPVKVYALDPAKPWHNGIELPNEG